MNVGATTPEGTGQYFAWGETTGYGSDTRDGRSFDWQSYSWCNGTDKMMTKYCSNSDYGTVDEKTELDLEDDAAFVNWGEDWRMPTRSEVEELCNNTDYEVTSINGVRGVKFTSKSNANAIFLPAADMRNGSRLEYDGEGERGYYWSSSPTTSNGAYFLDIHPTYRDPAIVNYHYRFYGSSIRPVYRGDSTEIEDVHFDINTDGVVKYLKNGTIIIKKGGKKYNIAGVHMGLGER